MSLAPYLAQETSPELVTVKFRFQVDSSGDVDGLFPGYQGVSGVVHDSAGVYTITFDQKWPALLGARGSVLAATADDVLAVVVDLADYDSDAGTLIITLLDDDGDGTYTAADPVDDDWVYVEATFCRRNALQATQVLVP